MGLDVSHDAYSGGYGGFNIWRDVVARAAGYDFGFAANDEGNPQGRLTVLIDWGHVTEDNLFGRWVKLPADPLLILIAHYDCDGEIMAEHCEPLAVRLEELLPLIVNDPKYKISFRKTTQYFIEGLRSAVAASEPLEFA